MSVVIQSVVTLLLASSLVPDGPMGGPEQCREGLHEGLMQRCDAEGNVVWQQTYRDKTLHGPAVKFHRPGVKEWEGDFNDGVEHGPWTWWHGNGKVKIKAEYEKGKRHGAWESRWANGKVRCRGKYENDLRTSKWKCRHRNGKKAMTANFADGAPIGKWRTWHPNGNRAANGRYGDDGPVGDWNRWHSNGKKAAHGRSRVFTDKDVDKCLKTLALLQPGLGLGGKECACREQLGHVIGCQALKGKAIWEWTYWHDNGKVAAKSFHKQAEYFDRNSSGDGDMPSSFKVVFTQEFARAHPETVGEIRRRFNGLSRRWEMCHARAVEKGPERWWLGKVTALLAIDSEGYVRLSELGMPAVDLDFEQCLENHLPKLSTSVPAGRESPITVEAEFFSPVP